MIVLAGIETVTVGLIAFYAAAISDPSSTLQALVKSQFWNISSLFLQTIPTPKGLIGVLSVLVMLAIVVKNLARGVLTLRIARFGASVESYCGSRLLENYLYRDYLWHLQQNSADLVQRVNWRSWLGRNFIVPHLKIMTEVVMLIALLSGLLLIQPVVSLLFIAFQGTVGIFVYHLLRRGLDRSARECSIADISMNRTATLSMHGFKDVKVTGRERFFLDRYRQLAKRFSRYFGWQQFWRESPLLVLESIGFILIAGAILFMLFVLGYSPLKTTGTTALLAVTAWRCLPAFNRVISSKAGIRAALPYVEPLIADLSCSISSPTVDSQQVSFTKRIECREIGFTYEDHKTVLSGFNLMIERGASIGIMGPSGCGKSTLIDLLTGLLEPQTGQILVDGEPLTQDSLRSWRKMIGYVPQFPYIFDGSIAQNVAFGFEDEEIDRNGVLEACSLGAVDFLDDLQDGIDTLIGERGVRLSGGQRQRIAIARALYRNPQLLIFDEATSALDEEKDAQIRDLIQSLKGRLTFIVVSHRPSTVEGCNEVVHLS